MGGDCRKCFRTKWKRGAYRHKKMKRGWPQVKYSTSIQPTAQDPRTKRRIPFCCWETKRNRSKNTSTPPSTLEDQESPVQPSREWQPRTKSCGDCTGTQIPFAAPSIQAKHNGNQKNNNSGKFIHTAREIQDYDPSRRRRLVSPLKNS
jgi:hypothetical protein